MFSILLHYLDKRFTRLALIVAAVIAVILIAVLPEGLFSLMGAIIAPFGYTLDDFSDQTPGVFPVLFFPMIPSLVLLYLSELIDVTDDTSGERNYADCFHANIVAGLNVLMLLVLFTFSYFAQIGHAVGSNSNQGFISGLLTILFSGIVAFILFIPAIVLLLLSPLIVAVTLIGGLLCLPHVVMYYATVHPLRRVPEKVAAQGQVPAQDVIDGLGGQPGTFMAEKAKLHQLRQMMAQLDETKRLLQEERDRLKQNILEVTARKEAEIDVSKRLAEIDILLAEIARYKSKHKDGPDI